MVSFPYERRSGRDRRTGGERRQLDRRLPQDGDEREEYEENIERAAEMTAHLGEVWHGKGKDLYGRDQFEDAAKALKKAVEIKPDIAEAWFLLACLESIKGEKEEALSLLAKALKLEPGFREQAKAHSAFKKYRVDEDFEKIIQ